MFIKKFLKSVKSNYPHNVHNIRRIYIEQVGRKFYIYANCDNTKKIIGTYNNYEQAKQVVDKILELKLQNYGT